MPGNSTVQRILKPGHNVWKTARADEAGVIVDAADYYFAFYEAAREAKKTILLSGWQFDSGVPLLRGRDVTAGTEVRLLKFLDQLCEQRPELEIYILAWDFHVVFSLEREWMQTLYFHWATNKRLHFRFDGAQPAHGSHHQKFAVIDRTVSFLGGIDLCEARWDDREHRAENPLRLSHDEPVKPYHDTQAYFTGCDVADVLRELFLDRWERSEGNPLNLARCEASKTKGYRPRGGLPIGEGGEIAFSRTDPRAPNDTIREIETLFGEAIAAAEGSIYIETQYFSSRAIVDALIKRMREQHRPRLEIVVVLNEKPEALKEEIAIGLRQAKSLLTLSNAAAETGHALGIFDCRSEGEANDRPSTYIHSKLLIVDDRFLSVGSANLTNRSMGVDTELHASWEATGASDHDQGLVQGIANLRVSLLAEHMGLLVNGAPTDVAEQQLAGTQGLVGRLDDFAKTKNARLRAHAIASEKEKQLMGVIDPQALPFDPENPDYGDGGQDHAEEEAQSRPLFVGGLTALWEKLKPR